MTEEEKEYLERLYAGFAMIGFLMNGDYSPEEIPSRAKNMAKAMMEDETEEDGIVAIKKKRYVRKN
jgi:hypothetical protein